MMNCLHNSPVTKIGIVRRMADSITGYLWRHRVNLSLKFSDDWVHKKQDNWNKIKQHLNLVKGKLKDGKEKVIIHKMLKRCLGAAYQYKECEEMKMLQDEVEQRKREEMLLPLRIDQLL